jgi:hypothetical protein
MSEFLQALTTVWTGPALLVAAGGGLLIGFVVLGGIARLPTYVSSATPAQVGLAVSVFSIVAAAVFYLGQASVDTAEDIPARLLSRFSVWCIYSAGMGLGTWLRLRLEQWRHGHRVRTQATLEVEAETTAHAEARAE